MFTNKDNNSKEFIKQYKKYYSKIYNYIARSILRKEEAEDLTSTVFLKIFDYINKNNPDIKNFNAWIYKIATNEMLSRLKYKEGKQNLIFDESGQDIGDSLLSDSGKSFDKYLDFMTVQKALSRLKPFEKSIIELYYFENLSYTEISDILDIKEVSLRSVIHRTLKKLRDMMDN